MDSSGRKKECYVLETVRSSRNRLSHGLAAMELCPRSMESIEELFLQSPSEQGSTEVSFESSCHRNASSVMLMAVLLTRDWK